MRDNKREKRSDAVVSGHQFLRNDTGVASWSVLVGRPFLRGRAPVVAVAAAAAAVAGDGDDPVPVLSGSSAPFLSVRPVVYQAPLRITSIKTLGAPRWSRRSPLPSSAPVGAGRFYFSRVLPEVGALAWVKTVDTRRGREVSISFSLSRVPRLPPSTLGAVYTDPSLLRKKMSYRRGSRKKRAR